MEAHTGLSLCTRICEEFGHLQGFYGTVDAHPRLAYEHTYIHIPSISPSPSTTYNSSTPPGARRVLGTPPLRAAFLQAHLDALPLDRLRPRHSVPEGMLRLAGLFVRLEEAGVGPEEYLRWVSGGSVMAVASHCWWGI
jgi:hypothetical protein